MRALISARSCFLDRRQRAFRRLKTDLPKTNATIETFVNFVNVMFTNVNATALNVRGDVSLIFRCAAPIMVLMED
jgi:hypothetical protein